MAPIWPDIIRAGHYSPTPDHGYPQWGQAIALPTRLVADMLDHGNRSRMPAHADDSRIYAWARATGTPASYLIPSLVDSTDVRSTVTHAPRGNRRAVWFADDPMPRDVVQLLRGDATDLP